MNSNPNVTGMGEVTSLRFQKTIAIFGNEQRLLSIDMKTKVVQHVPRIKLENLITLLVAFQTLLMLVFNFQKPCHTCYRQFSSWWQEYFWFSQVHEVRYLGNFLFYFFNFYTSVLFPYSRRPLLRAIWLRQRA